MKVMVIVKATKESEAGVMPDEKTITEMGKFKEELVKAGVMLGGEGLHPSRKGKRLHISGSRKALIVPSPRRRSWSTSTRSAARSTPSPCPRSISRELGADEGLRHAAVRLLLQRRVHGVRRVRAL